MSGGTPKAAPGLPAEGVRPRGSIAAPSSGRWQRGVALPPSEDGGRRRERDAENPNELWDDPLGGAMGAAADFSAFGAMPEDPTDPSEPFDFDKMAEASKKLEEEMHGDRAASADDDDPDNQQHTVKIDPKRPLASIGTTITSGSGDDVNVFEDFDAPGSEPENDAAAVRSGDADPTASSRLMKMIGVNRDPPQVEASSSGENKETPSNPWGSSTNEDIPNRSEHSSGGDIIGSVGGAQSSVPSNPWGDPVVPSAAPQQQSSAGGMDLAARLGAFAAEQKAREAQVAVQMEQRVQEAEILRRRQEEEAQRRAMAQRQADEQRAYQQQQQQQAQAAAMQQQQQQQGASQQSQVELVLMERICAILENSWGRSDLVSILSTLHSEDSRVIPLLGNVDALRALISRHPQRVALRRDPNFAGDMAVLVLTNSQWQQQQASRARARQEEMQRLEQQRRMEEEARARSEAQNRVVANINPDAPWFYSDPQNNIQVRALWQFRYYEFYGLMLLTLFLALWDAIGSFPRRGDAPVARSGIFQRGSPNQPATQWSVPPLVCSVPRFISCV